MYVCICKCKYIYIYIYSSRHKGSNLGPSFLGPKLDPL